MKTKIWHLVLLSVSIISVFTVHADDAAFDYTLGAGDEISVFVWKQPSLSRAVVVRPDGKISYPLVGEVTARGMTTRQLEGVIQERLAKHILYPKVTVIAQALHSYRIYVIGEVVRPGVYELKGPVSIVQALAIAGGFTPYAKQSEISVVNQLNRKEGYSFDFKSYIKKEKRGPVPVLTRGDTVLVP